MFVAEFGFFHECLHNRVSAAAGSFGNRVSVPLLRRLTASRAQLTSRKAVFTPLLKQAPEEDDRSAGGTEATVGRSVVRPSDAEMASKGDGRIQVEKRQRVLPWWRLDQNGSYVFVIR